MIQPILALNENHDASAAVATDSGIWAIASERLTGSKHSSSGLDLAIDYVLDAADLAPTAIGQIVRCLSPADERNLARQWIPGGSQLSWITQRHHRLHALGAYWQSGFGKAAVLVVDGLGSPTSSNLEDGFECTSIFAADAGELSLEFQMPTTYQPYDFDRERIGVGRLYSYVSKHIFKSRYDAGKVMALAAFGDPSLVESFLDEPLEPIRGSAVRGLETTGVGRENPMDFADLAARVQADTETVMLALAARARDVTGLSQLVIAGGVGLNCPANSLIASSGLFEDVFVMPACTDDGVALGGLAAGLVAQGLSPRTVASPGAFLGTRYSHLRIERALAALGTGFVIDYVPDRQYRAEKVAALLVGGSVVARFAGSSEFGPRALGNRSILAVATSTKMRDHINARIKGREWFRPLAPAVLAGRVDEMFLLPDVRGPSEYMLLTGAATSQGVAIMPAAVHVDGSARVQTVDERRNGEFAALLTEVGRLSGVPGVLNTSLNGPGQPIVETPEQFVAFIASAGVDAGMIGGYVISRRSPARALLES